MRNGFLALAGLAFALSAGPAPASAADVIDPADGSVVGAQPRFTLDQPLPGASLAVEYSKSPELLTGGSRAGWFVEPLDDLLKFLDEPPHTSVQMERALLAGPYHWRGFIQTYGDGPSSTWTPVRTLTIRDEPVVLDGAVVRAERLRRRGRCSRVRLTGTVAYRDNDAAPRPIGIVRVRDSVGRLLTRVTWRPYPTASSSTVSARFSVTACVRTRRFKVTVAVRDRQGAEAVSPARDLAA